MDNAWEQEKLEARKMLENAADSHTSGAPMMMASDHFIREDEWATPCGHKLRVLLVKAQFKQTVAPLPTARMMNNCSVNIPDRNGAGQTVQPTWCEPDLFLG